MSCYAKHPDVPGIECWHGPGHAGDHGKESRSWPNIDDPLQVELAALRKVADAAAAFDTDGSSHQELADALKDVGR